MTSTGKRTHSIRTRFFLPLLVLLLPILVIEAYIFYDRFATRQAEELQANLELARAVGVAFHGLVQDVLREELAIATAATASPSLSREDLAKLLRQSAKGDPAVSRFSWVGAEGRVLASSNPSLVGINISDRRYFKEIVGGREWVVSDLVISKATGEPIFTISRAARDEKGTFLGMLTASFYPDGLEKVLAIKRAKGAAVDLIDRNGINVARYPPRDHTPEQLNLRRSYPQIEGALRGQEIATTVISERTGRKRLAGFVPIPSTGWVAAASRDQSDAMGDFTYDLLIQGTLFLLVALAAFGTALAIARWAVASIGKLRDQALALGRGETKEPVDVFGPSEIVELADTFGKMAEDIRKREEALLQEREFAEMERKRLQAVLEALPVSLFISDANGKLVVTNPAADEIWGQAPLSRRLENYREDYKAWWPTTGKRVQSHEWGLARSLTSGERCIAEEMEIETPDGRRKIILNYALPILDAEGRITGGVAVNVDITERKRMEDALRRAKDELEFRVKERTAELELRNKELQDFTFVAAHDLQEPLRKIRTFGNMLAKRCGPSMDERSMDYLNRMQTSAGRMQNLLHSLLTYSRVTGKFEPIEEIDLRTSVAEAVSNLEILIEEKNAHLEIGDLPTIAANPVQMVQLFQNLLGNALKFHREGESPRVKINAQTDEEGLCEIYVQDNGIGFEEMYVDKVFLPFQRLHGISGGYEGVGMGLAICKKIVESHGGKITARSEVGKGSTFVVALPAERKKR
jgi:PAS domain S-box-containing protein